MWLESYRQRSASPTRHTSPMEYPKISDDRFIKPLANAIKAVHQYDCRYIIQIGDTGGATHTSLFPQDVDTKSTSSGGYCIWISKPYKAMTIEEIEQTRENFIQAAAVFRDGCRWCRNHSDKVISFINFLNPGINRRTDAYGGSIDKRFRLLEKLSPGPVKQWGMIFRSVSDCLASDINRLPVNLRLPVLIPA